MNRRLVPILILLVFSPPLLAETPAEKGLRIAQAADRRDNGWRDQTADMTMILRNRAGRESVRRIRSKMLEVQDDGDKSLSLFDEPADVKGTAMLTFSHGLRPDDQWLYLPALKRVKRIASRNKSGPFMGSEFAFEDLASQEVEKYRYRYLRREACGQGWQCHVIERIPAYKYSGYSKQTLWIDTLEYRPVKLEFYDRKDAHLKTLTWTDYRAYGNYWRADEMFMRNHQTGKTTTLKWSNYRFGTGLSSGDFNKNALARLR
ncbi:MAG: outer membrane lipoprotein-sorting protein [Candidatus Thiosymbion ectosymbiont of Robbea hypermnestra]|nr:outer membrane lipoprotein-sorting protein [Candidatus Thiosymbion ectosymbiont of Robbea hypermnestra]